MTTFEDAKVGDRVFHYKYGWSTITNIKKELFPIGSIFSPFTTIFLSP